MGAKSEEEEKRKCHSISEQCKLENVQKEAEDSEEDRTGGVDSESSPWMDLTAVNSGQVTRQCSRLMSCIIGLSVTSLS